MSSIYYNIWLFIFNILIILFIYIKILVIHKFKSYFLNKTKSLTFYWLDDWRRAGLRSSTMILICVRSNQVAQSGAKDVKVSSEPALLHH